MAVDTDTVQLGFALPLRDASPDDDASGNDASERDQPETSVGHRSPRWSDWDGGKVGGRPSWLNPRFLPTVGPLRCVRCGDGGKKEATILRFVAQLYCPADDVTGNDAAFHRSLYVFACPTCCSARGRTEENGKAEGGSADDDPPPSSHRLAGCVRVLRCQLPRRNDFYPAKGDDEGGEGGWTRHASRYWAESASDDGLNLCAVCGQRSRGKCPKQQLWFCGADHQKECLRASKKRPPGQDDSEDDVPIRYLPSVCYESELVVEEEPASAIEYDNALEEGANLKKTSTSSTLFPSKDVADVDMEQSDLNAITMDSANIAQAITGVTDSTTLAFYARMAVGGSENDVRNQCLRYCQWPEKESDGGAAVVDEDDEGGAGPLWLTSSDRPPPARPAATAGTTADSAGASSFPPPCQYCGSPRSFEFQVLPQMLHHLLRDPDADEDAADDEKSSRQVLTESERAVLLEARARIEGGADLPEGFSERHDAAVANAREALLGTSNDGKGNGGKSSDDGGGSKGGLDWGTIAVYTCTASCGDGGATPGGCGAYREEAAWMQPPLD